MPSDHILQTKSRHRPSTSQGFVGIEVGRYGRNYFKKGKDARLNTLEGVIKKFILEALCVTYMPRI